MIRFNDITKDELTKYNNKAFVFNMCLEEMKKINVIENKFTTEDLGESAEHIDIFIDLIDKDITHIRDFLNMGSFFIKETDSDSGIYNVGGMVELLESNKINFKGILVIVRAMSSFLLDRKDSSETCMYYSKCSKEIYDILENTPSLSGLLAKQKVRLTSNYKEEIIRQLDYALQNKIISKFTYDGYRKII